MKHVLVFAILLFSSLLCEAQSKESSGIVFVNPVYNFGIVKKGSAPEHTFILVNRTKIPLLITNVISYCSCLETIWSKQPLAPNDSGLVKVKYNAHSTGTFNKTIKVLTNQNAEPINLTIKGEFH